MKATKPYSNLSSDFFCKFGKVLKFSSRFRKKFDFHEKYLSLFRSQLAEKTQHESYDFCASERLVHLREIRVRKNVVCK